MAVAENLTIMFVDMAGYSERTARQSREQNKALLRDFNFLLVPLIPRFGGRRVKDLGDAFLVTFRSPTDSVRCAMAMQDAVAEYNLTHGADDPLRIRVALNVGEVRVEKADVFGEAVNIAARIEQITPPGEIYLAGVVYLSMNKAEVASEHIGERELKGVPEKTRIFRVPSHQVARLKAVGGTELAGSLPYGGMHLLSADAPVFVRVNDAMLRARYVDWSARVRAIPARTVLAVVASLAATALVVSLGTWLFTSQKLEQISANAAAASPGGQPVVVNKAISAEAREALRAANKDYFERRRVHAARAYAKVLDMEPELQHDSGLAANLVGTLGASEIPIAAIRKYPSSEIMDELARRTGAPGRKGAERAAALLDEMNQGSRVDRVSLAITAFTEAPTCEERLDAVKRMRELKDLRALPLLRDNVRGGFKGFVGGMFSKDKNACLRDEAKATIAELEKLQQEQQAATSNPPS